MLWVSTAQLRRVSTSRFAYTEEKVTMEPNGRPYKRTVVHKQALFEDSMFVLQHGRLVWSRAAVSFRKDVESSASAALGVQAG